MQSVLSSGDDFSPNQNLSFCLASCQMQSVSSSGDDLSPIFQNFILSFCLASCQMHPCTGFRPTMICRSIRISFVLVAILSRKCSKCRWRRLVNCHLQLLPLLKSAFTLLFAQIRSHISHICSDRLSDFLLLAQISFHIFQLFGVIALVHPARWGKEPECK